MNIIGDIAGEYKTLLALIEKMPKDEIILLGDLNDRGPQSKEVIEWAIKTPNVVTMNSNHGHMMVEAYEQSTLSDPPPRYYEKGIWFYNGGTTTLNSYNKDWKNEIMFSEVDMGYGGKMVTYVEHLLHHLIPKNHINFLKNCPMYLKRDNFIISHAPHNVMISLDEASMLGEGFYPFTDEVSDNNLIWNRHVSKKYIPGKINIFGHNSSDKVKIYTTLRDPIKVDAGKITLNDIRAICLDSSGGKKLSGLHTPTMTIYEQEYL